jgi:UDPglucose 6-dehydrogenase
MARICIVGTGYVGLVSGACFADFGHEVHCIDIDVDRISALERGEIPFFEPGLDTLVRRNRDAGRLHFSTELSQGASASDVIMIAVQTPPTENGEADLKYVMQVGREIATLLEPGNYRVICTKSTVPVGTATALENEIRAHSAEGVEFDVASNPEFLREGSSIEDFMRPDRVVIGTRSERAEALMRSLYRPLFLLDTPIVATDVETSELIKYAANAFLAVKISYINEISNLCERVGAQVDEVAKAMGYDRRIGSKFLHAGLGFGGSCLPKDTKAVVQIAQGHGEELALVKAAIQVNDERVPRALRKLEAMIGSLESRRIGVLGLAFKPNTDDVREAPSLTLVPALRAAGATVVACDPEAVTNFRRHIPDLEIAEDAYACASGADALILLTEWNPYRELDLQRLAEAMTTPVLLDCRNVYSQDRAESSGLRYDSFGR